MPDKAHVTSVEALDAFRARLILYVSKARPALEEVSAEVLRVKLWLENDQRLHWEGEVRRCSRTLEQTRQAVSSARMSSLGQAGWLFLVVVRRNRRSCRGIRSAGGLTVGAAWPAITRHACGSRRIRRRHRSRVDCSQRVGSSC